MNLQHVLNGMASRAWGMVALLAIGIFLIGFSARRIARRTQPGGLRTLAWGVPVLLIGVLATTVAATVFVTRPQAVARRLFSAFAQDYADVERLRELQKTGLQANANDASLPGEWAQWRGPRRDGISPETDLLATWPEQGPPLLWRKPIRGGYSSIAVVGDRLYTMDRDGNQERILCFDSATGNEVWTFRYDVDYAPVAYGEGPRATPLVFEDRVYCMGATGMFHCLEAAPADGQPKVIWQHDLTREFDVSIPRWGLSGSPLIEGDWVIVQPGGSKGTIAAFERRTGKLIWSALTEQAGYSSPVAATCAGVRQIITLTAAGVSGLRAIDGTRLWHHPWTTDYDANIATPIVAGDYVFISSGYNTGCALLEIVAGGNDAMEARPVYVKNNKLMRNHHSTCVFAGGFLYGFDNDRLKCVDLKTGEEKWLAPRDVGKGSLIAAGERLIILSEQGQLILADRSPEEFRERGRIQLFETSNVWALPALAGGRLYVRDSKEIVCLDLRQPKQ